MISIAISEASQVAEARREAATIAQHLGFSPADAGRAALVATELATNLIKHGGGGEMLVGSFEDGEGSRVEILALDQGRGMADVEACLEDGYSSAGTQGHGLGAVIRQSQFVDIASWPGVGTAGRARVRAGRPNPARRPPRSAAGARTGARAA